jgi:DNA-directed RNA polymerase specialized sigma subunit
VTEREQIRLDIKRRLNSYRDLSAERAQILDELEQLENLMRSPSSPCLDGMPKSPGAGNPVERLVIKHITLQERYKGKVEEMVEEQAAIETLIEGLDPTERRLARFRYIDGLTWEDIADKLCYTWRHIHRIHGAMLNKLTDAEIEKRKAEEVTT